MSPSLGHEDEEPIACPDPDAIIDRLTKRVIELEATLLPFARYAAARTSYWTAKDDNAYYGVKHAVELNITYGNFRRALSVMGLKSAPIKSNKRGVPTHYNASLHVCVEYGSMQWLDLNRGDLTRSAFIRDLINERANLPRYRHVKRQSVVRVWGVAEAQCATDPINEGDRVVVYVHEDDGTKWIRREGEFRDGRFEEFKP